MVAATAPARPAIRYPTKVEELTAMTPGADWTMANMSKISSLSIQLFFQQFPLDVGDHSVSTAKGKGADSEKYCEQFQGFFNVSLFICLSP